MNRKSLSIGLLWAFLVVLTIASCKKDDDNNNNDTNPTGTEDYVLVIENGALGLDFEQSVTYTAYLVGIDGQIVTPETLTWESSASDVVNISAAGLVSVAGFGVAYVKATATYKGKTYTASAPVSINQTSIFTVVPQAIIWSTNAGNIQLTPVYLGQANPSYTYSSSNTSVANVSASGDVSFNAAGECTITVTATIDGSTYDFFIPVLVVGEPSVPLPITRVSVTPAAAELFRGETAQFTASAFNSSGQVNDATFNWTVSDPSIGTINANGLFTANDLGEVTVYATAEGVIGQAEVYVTPDTFIIVTPFSASKPKGGTQQYTAKTYKVDRNSGNLQEIANLPSLNWEVLTYGLPLFDIATVDNNGLATVRQSAMEGLSTVIMASYPNQPTIVPGSGLLQVAIGQPGGCDCGADNSDVDQVTVSNNSISLSLLGNPTQDLNAQALDALGDPVANANITYCSDNLQVANVDFTGAVTATGEGTATITVCVGSVQTTVNVSVSF